MSFLSEFARVIPAARAVSSLEAQLLHELSCLLREPPALSHQFSATIIWAMPESRVCLSPKATHITRQQGRSKPSALSPQPHPGSEFETGAKTD
ncbi:hypothetical protein AAE478_004926 [Parahypoxylon ruwenzoriense]